MVPHKFIEHLAAVSGLKDGGVTMNTWFKLRIRGYRVQDEEELADTRTVEAYPVDTSSIPNGNRLPSGRCQCVLVMLGPNAKPTGVAGTS